MNKPPTLGRAAAADAGGPHARGEATKPTWPTALRVGPRGGSPSPPPSSHFRARSHRASNAAS